MDTWMSERAFESGAVQVELFHHNQINALTET